MKQIRQLLLALVLVLTFASLALTGCTRPESRELKPWTNTTGINGSGRPGDINGDGLFKVGYISKNASDPFHVPINTRAQEVFDAMKVDGLIDDWTGVLDGGEDPARQIDLAQQCIDLACDVVIILPAEAEASAPALTALDRAGIAIVVVNSKTNNTDDLAIAYSGSDDVFAGNQLAQYIIDNVTGGGKYIHIQGVLGNSAQIQRGEGIDALMDKQPDFEKVEEISGNWKSEEAWQITAAALEKYGSQLVAIICDNDDMSSGAQSCCNEQGRQDIVCIGVDGGQTPLSMVKSGAMQATILQDGLGQIEAAFSVVKTLAEGRKWTEKNIDVPFILVTADNVDDFYHGG